ncbi:MAG: hypothetical protein COB00_18035 [Alcanivorax sp.]|nr:MAG: hypothetical protein COB00_18035 [Alcanivorax sp.]
MIIAPPIRASGSECEETSVTGSGVLVGGAGVTFVREEGAKEAEGRAGGIGVDHHWANSQGSISNNVAVISVIGEKTRRRRDSTSGTLLLAGRSSMSARILPPWAVSGASLPEVTRLGAAE